MTGIGYFGDRRRAEVGAELLERAVHGGSLVLRKLGGDRAGEMRYQRFLSAGQVSVEEMLATAGAHTAAAAWPGCPGSSPDAAVGTATTTPRGPKTMRDDWDTIAKRLKGYAQALYDLQTADA